MNFIETKTGIPTQRGLRLKHITVQTISNFKVTIAKTSAVTAVLSVNGEGKGVLKIDVKKGPNNAAQSVRYNVTCKKEASSSAPSDNMAPDQGNPFPEHSGSPFNGTPFPASDPFTGSPF